MTGSFPPSAEPNNFLLKLTGTKPMDNELELDLELLERARLSGGFDTHEEVLEEALKEWINRKLAERMNLLSDPFLGQAD
jgi:hypothetical protein